MAFTRAERAAILAAKEEVADKLKVSPEAIDHIVRGGTTEERSAMVRRSMRGMASRGTRSAAIQRTYDLPLPRRDRRLERAIRDRAWKEVREAITPVGYDGKKLRDIEALNKAMKERA